MEIRKAKLGLLVLAAALALPLVGGPVRADQSDRTHLIGAKLKCMCGGCEQSAGKCYHVGGAYSGPCDTAKTMLKEIDQHIAEGKSDDQVLHAMIAQYGPLAYMEPPKSGFGLIAWLTPLLYLLVGTGLVIFIMKRWRKRVPVQASSPAVAGAGAPGNNLQVTPELLERARELARRETEE